MFAVIELGGKQYLVKEKDVLQIEKLPGDPNTETKTDKVLLTSNESETHIGTPYLKGAEVTLKIRKTGLGDKIRIFKMKAKKRYRRLRGHRQPFTEVEITKISA